MRFIRPKPAMSTAHASSSVTLPLPSPAAARASLARNAPDDGDSEGTSRRMDMLLLGARAEARAKMCAQGRGIESVGEGEACVGGSYLRRNRQTIPPFLERWCSATYRTHMTHTPYPRTGTRAPPNTPVANRSTPRPLLVVHSGRTTTARPAAFASLRIASRARAAAVGTPYEAGVHPVRASKRGRGTGWNPASGVGGTESVLSAAEPVPVWRPVGAAGAGAAEGRGATGRTKIGSKLVRRQRRLAQAENAVVHLPECEPQKFWPRCPVGDDHVACFRPPGLVWLCGAAGSGQTVVKKCVDGGRDEDVRALLRHTLYVDPPESHRCEGHSCKKGGEQPAKGGVKGRYRALRAIVDTRNALSLSDGETYK